VSVSVVYATPENFGIDDWTCSDVSQFLKLSGVDISEELLLQHKVDGVKLMQMDTATLTSLGLSAAEFVSVTKSINEKVTAVSQNPVDLWEYRALNLRMHDYWLLPMTSSSRLVLLYSRYFDSGHIIDKIDHEIDELSTFKFWSLWIFSPSYPLYQVAQKFNDKHSWLDDMVEYILLMQSIFEPVGMLGLLLTGSDGVLKIFSNGIGQMIGTLIYMYFGYYCVWWFIPRVVLNILFAMQVYIIWPGLVLILFFTALGAGALATLVPFIDQKKIR